MLFMVIETIRDRDSLAVYRRFSERGRLMPDGLVYVDSWVGADLGRVFQLMECEDPRLFQQWIAEWGDLMDFELVPVVTSRETFEGLEPFLSNQSFDASPGDNE